MYCAKSLSKSIFLFRCWKCAIHCSIYRSHRLLGKVLWKKTTGWYQPPGHAFFFPERKSAKGAGNEWVGRLLFFGGRLIFRGEMFVFTQCNPHPTKKNTSAMKKSVAKSWTDPYWFYTRWDPTSYRWGYNYIPYKYWGYNPSYLVFGHL